MNEHWEKTLKKEADHVLFEEVSFDDRLKEKVREKIKAKRKWWQRKWSTQVAAASILLLIASVSLFQLGDSGAPVAIENDPVIDDSPSVLIGDEDPDIGIPPSWALDSLDEARIYFSSELLVPELSVEWHLSIIRGYGEAREELEKLELNYVTETESIVVIAERQYDFASLEAYESMVIRGRDGWKRIDALTPELIWSEQGMFYTLTGSLSEAELIDITETMTQIK